MKKITSLSIFLFLSSMALCQSLELQATTDFSSQLRLRSPDGTEEFDIQMKNDGSLRFIANGNFGTQVMHIDDHDGHVGIGTPVLSISQLFVKNNESTFAPRRAIFGFADGEGSFRSRYGVFGLATGTTGNQYGIYGSVDTGTGHWGVYCSGNMWYTGSLTSQSDRRFKSNIQPMDKALLKIMRMKPRSYTFKQKNIKSIPLSQGPQLGFIAQELEEVFPQLVETNMHDILALPGVETEEQIEIKGINYIGLIPVLTKAIQEQQEIINDHKLKLETQQSQITLLISQNERTLQLISKITD